ADTVVVALTASAPLPAGDLAFDGGAGTNSLTLRGSTGFDSETYTPSGPASGSITFTKGINLTFPPPPPPPPNITYANVYQIMDTLSLSNLSVGGLVIPPSFIFNGSAAADNITILDGFGSPLPQEDLLISNNPTSAPTFFANKPDVHVNGLAGTDTVAVNFLSPAVGLVNLTVDGGAGNDTLNVQSVGAGVAVTANGSDGDDQV